jgi:hypothetical protein
MTVGRSLAAGGSPGWATPRRCGAAATDAPPVGVTLWETTVKQATGKLSGPADLAGQERDMGFPELPPAHTHAIAADRLPLHHRDPLNGCW